MHKRPYFLRYGLLSFIYDINMESKSKDPLDGITLKAIAETLVEYYGFDTLGELIAIKCFTENPTVKSSLTFLRKTDFPFAAATFSK